MSGQLIETRHVGRITFLILLFLTFSVALFLSRQVITHNDYPFDTDEANHALGGLEVADALMVGDWLAAVSQSYNKDFYPPAADWLSALVFLLFGATPTTARLVGVACLFFACLVIFAIGLLLDERRGWLAGLVAVSLTVTAQPLLVYSTLNMLEAPGLLVSMGFLYAYLHVLRRPTRHNLLVTSVLLILTFLTKYTYGVVIVATLFLVEASLFFTGHKGESFRQQLKQQTRRRWLWLLGPFVVGLVVWFGSPDKLATFFTYTRPLSDEQAWFSLDNVVYYIRSVMIHYGPGPIFSLVTLASLIWAGLRWRDPRLRLLLVYFLVGMAAMMIINHPANPRFIATFVPAAHLLTGGMAVWLLRRWRRTRQQRVRLRLLGVTLVLLFAIIIGIPVVIGRYAAYPSALEAYFETTPENNAMANWIDENLPADATVLLVNYWDQFSPQTLAWYLESKSQWKVSPIVVKGKLVEPATPQAIADLQQTLAAEGITHLVLLEGGPWGAPFWPAYSNALADKLELLADREFTLQMYDAADYLDHASLEPESWEPVKAESRYEMNVGVIIYKLN